jgi:hypothetical protein
MAAHEGMQRFEARSPSLLFPGHPTFDMGNVRRTKPFGRLLDGGVRPSHADKLERHAASAAGSGDHLEVE